MKLRPQLKTLPFVDEMFVNSTIVVQHFITATPVGFNVLLRVARYCF